MGIEDDLRALVDDAYVAALDETRWPGWSERLAEALGGTASAFGVVDGATGTVVYHHLGRFDARAHEDYAAGMNAIDPHRAFFCSLDRSLLFVETDYLHDDDPAAADYMRWQASVAGVASNVSAAVRLGGGNLKVGIVAHRRTDDGPTPDGERAKLAAILPRVANAIELGFVHAAKLQDSYWDGLLTRSAEPAALLDGTGKVLRLTPDLERLLAQADGLCVRRDRFEALKSSENMAIQAAIRRTRTPGDAARAMPISRRSGRPPYLLTIYPLSRRPSLLSPADGAAALVTVVDPAFPATGDTALWQGAFGFTARETEFAALLMIGHSVESAAASLGIALGTARVHLRSLFAKTDTGRQSALVRLLARLGHPGGAGPTLPQMAYLPAHGDAREQ